MVGMSTSKANAALVQDLLVTRIIDISNQSHNYTYNYNGISGAMESDGLLLIVTESHK